MTTTLNKTQRLKSPISIKRIFDSRCSVSVYPLRVIWEKSEEGGVKAAFSVSKRNFKRAVDRNRIKRLMRESYRLQRDEMLKNIDGSYNMVFVYAQNTIIDYPKMYHTMGTLLSSWVDKNSNQDTSK